MRYIFILGHNPKLSVAEITAVLPSASIVEQTDSFLVLESETLDCAALMKRLGGTIKIAEVIGERIEARLIIGALERVEEEGKLNFGISYYDCAKDRMGMDVKRQLQQLGKRVRLVTSKEKILSSVVVTKNNCHEFMVLRGRILAQTRAVQDFEDYSHRDFGRPERDVVSGTLPPKVAKIMINLSQQPLTAHIHDPFCGSGTIIQEALLMGYEHVSGSDVSEKAVSDTTKNLQWLRERDESPIKEKKVSISNIDVRELSRHVHDIDAIITEPYLGPALRGESREHEVQTTIKELSDLYEYAFSEFQKIVKPNGRVVMVFPVFRVGGHEKQILILGKIKQLGFIPVSEPPVRYSRADQKVMRDIWVFIKS